VTRIRHDDDDDDDDDDDSRVYDENVVFA